MEPSHSRHNNKQGGRTIKYIEMLNALKQGNVTVLFSVIIEMITRMMKNALEEAHAYIDELEFDEESEFMWWCNNMTTKYSEQDDDEDEWDVEDEEIEEDERYAELVKEIELNLLEESLRDAIYSWSVDEYNLENPNSEYYWCIHMSDKYEELSKKLDEVWKSPYEIRQHTEEEEEQEWFLAMAKRWSDYYVRGWYATDYIDALDAAAVMPKHNLQALYDFMYDNNLRVYLDCAAEAANITEYYRDLCTDADRATWYHIAKLVCDDYIEYKRNGRAMTLIPKFISEAINISYDDAVAYLPAFR